MKILCAVAMMGAGMALTLGGCTTGDGQGAGSDAENAISCPDAHLPDSSGDALEEVAHTCCIPPLPSGAGVELRVAFPHLEFVQPLLVTHASDGSNRLFVVEQTGKAHVFPNNRDVQSTHVFLDLSGRVTKTDGEGGFLGLAFHPIFATNRTLYVSYTTGVAANFRSVVSEFRTRADNPDEVDPATERIVLELPQPYSNHNGGMIAFGPDGLLYVGFGDGGSANDPKNNGQNLGTLLGTILRIDPSPAPSGSAYQIPDSNPFIGVAGARPEIWAYGLRNPWRFSFDPLTGALWAGDVGQDAWEEIDIIEAGKNYGWRIMEGSHCFNPSIDCDPTGLTPPVLEYSHDVGRSITGGVVYRGTRAPSLYGAYLYADFRDRLLFAYRHGEEEPAPRILLGSGVPNIASFGVDEANEVYLAAFDGRIYELVDTTGDDDSPTAPATLLETGCFSDLASLSPATGVHPYTVRAPFWSDGAHKERLFSLPAGQTLSFDAAGELVVPDGTVFIKHFFFDVPTPGGGTERRRVETRLLAKLGAGVYGYTYAWAPDQSNATLLTSGSSVTLDAISSPGAPASPLTWHIPSPNQCGSCHTEAAGGILGFERAQLDWAPDGTKNQLDAWVAAGLLLPSPAGGPDLTPLVDPADANLPVEERARSYLHSNCAGCHVPGGTTGVELDLRAHVQLAESGMCRAPVRNDLGIDDARIVAPGEPERSVLWKRMHAGPAHRMPPLATSIVDATGNELIRSWIEGLSICPDAGD